jgi:hypothetical protein
MERQLERCCGLDVHKETIAACVRIGGRLVRVEFGLLEHRLVRPGRETDTVVGALSLRRLVENDRGASRRPSYAKRRGGRRWSAKARRRSAVSR